MASWPEAMGAMAGVHVVIPDDDAAPLKSKRTCTERLRRGCCHLVKWFLILVGCAAMIQVVTITWNRRRYAEAVGADRLKIFERMFVGDPEAARSNRAFCNGLKDKTSVQEQLCAKGPQFAPEVWNEPEPTEVKNEPTGFIANSRRFLFGTLTNFQIAILGAVGLGPVVYHRESIKEKVGSLMQSKAPETSSDREQSPKVAKKRSDRPTVPTARKCSRPRKLPESQGWKLCILLVVMGVVLVLWYLTVFFYLFAEVPEGDQQNREIDEKQNRESGEKPNRESGEKQNRESGVRFAGPVARGLGGRGVKLAEMDDYWAFLRNEVLE